MIRFMLGFALTTALSIEVLAGLTVGDVQKQINRTEETVSWIFSTSVARRPTGNPVSFYGDQLSFIIQNNRPANGADVSFGYYLYRTYDMYCTLKGLKANCLGRKLRTHFTMTGSEQSSSRLIYVETPKGSFSTNYLQEARYNYFVHLESIGGMVASSELIRKELSKGRLLRIKSDFLVTLDQSGKGNISWRNYTYTQKVLRTAESILKNTIGFSLGANALRNDSSLYSSASQLGHLKLAESLSAKGKIQVVVSGPKTTSSSGLSWEGVRYNPHFAMKSRFNDWSSPAKYMTAAAFDNNAKIFLHELGHNMGLGHCVKNQGSKLCTDNYFNLNEGRQFLVRYLNAVGGLKVTYEY